MANVVITAPATLDITLSTSYAGSGSRWEIRNATSATVVTDDSTIGYTVQMIPQATSQNDPFEEYMEPGSSPWSEPLRRGKVTEFDAKSDSGTPTITVKVV